MSEENKQQNTEAMQYNTVLAPVDFKYMQIPNICFSLTDADDKREMEFKKQRLERGFDDSETWSLRDTIANFIIPRLERYEEIAKDFIKREPELEEDIIRERLSITGLCMEHIDSDYQLCINNTEELDLLIKQLNEYEKN